MTEKKSQIRIINLVLWMMEVFEETEFENIIVRAKLDKVFSDTSFYSGWYEDFKNILSEYGTNGILWQFSNMVRSVRALELMMEKM